jgi:serine/threonine-protein kinase
MIASVDRLVEMIRDSRLLDASRIKTLSTSLQTAYPESQLLAQQLVERGWLTDYQLKKVMQGYGADLILGPYVILERIGQGSMGDVFKAQRRKGGQVVALKVIRPDRRADGQALRRFRREVDAMARVSHPNIVSACDVDEIGVAHYYAMEYVDGANLDRIIAHNGPLPIAPACDYARQAALGLQHAHECGLIHRDIKPGNLLVARPTPEANGVAAPAGLSAEAQGRFGHWGIVKILDLGLARLADRNAQPTLLSIGSSLGTVDYMAPEQIEDPTAVDIRADLYSLGCTLYEMLTGKPPFPEGSPVAKMTSHQSREAVPVEELRPETPAPMAVIVKKLMAKKPADRFQQPIDVSTELAEVLVHLEPIALALDWQLAVSPENPTVPAPDPTAPSHHTSWRTDHVFLAIVLAAIGIIILLAVLGEW